MSKENYLNNTNLKAINVKIPWSEDMINEYIKCSTDQIYFIKTYCKIVNVDKGLISFDLWPFQEEMINTFEENRYTICKLLRQCGKTTTTCAYLLHKILFNESYNVAVLANKEGQAREILSRVKLMFEHLPKFLQQGIIEWNKGSIELENGSKVMASATGGSSVRGKTFSLLVLDEFAFVPNNIQEEFFASVYPTITSGKTTKVIITSTPNGMNLFYKIWTESEEGRNSYKRCTVNWYDVPGRDEKFKEEYINNTSERQWRQEFETEFLGSSNTLIDAKTLQRLVWKTPLKTFEHFDIYEDPIKNNKYVITVDTSRGVGIDYSAFVVFDVTDIPYKIVAKYRHNEISPLLYPNIIWRAGRYYNDAMVLIEVNDNGQQIADILFYDLEYEGVLLTQSRGKQGIRVGGGYKVKPIRGVKTTKQVKRIGCANLKTLIEEDKLLFNDYHLIYELFRFIEHNATYQAEEGEHDDMVMCCVLFAWLAHQRYFRNKTETDVRDDLWQENKEIIEDSVTPFGIFNDNAPAPTKVTNPRDFYNLDIHPNDSSYNEDDLVMPSRIFPPSW